MLSSKTSPNSPQNYLEFAHTQPTNAVRIENIPDHVDRRELVAIFRSLIGDVQCFRDVKERNQEQLEITFHNRNTAARALCMNGYSIGGASLSVTAVTLQVPRAKASSDERRNLYVLGLPFALTKNEFTSIFARYGVVTHSVILATVDNSSRRRGFVVMASHAEARQALAALTRSQIKGHTIDVSWAVVQRSQGFLDGGDRSLLLDSRSSHLPTSGSIDRRAYSSSGSDTSDYSPVLNDSAGLRAPTAETTTTLLITNLPALLFSQIQDLHPLLCPFGPIERIQTVQIPNADTISAVVQYNTPEAALEAKATLNGQRYDNVYVETHFVHPSFGEAGNDPRTPASQDSKVSPRASRAPTPMLGFQNPIRKNSIAQMTGHTTYGTSNQLYLPTDGNSNREAFWECLDDRLPSSVYPRCRTGSTNGPASFNTHDQGIQFYPNNAYENMNFAN